MQPEIQRVTVHIPKNLLDDAREVTGKGITDTIREALARLSKGKVYEKLRKLRGKCNLSIDLDESREDRHFNSIKISK